jgi:hypothetical protein
MATNTRSITAVVVGLVVFAVLTVLGVLLAQRAGLVAAGRTPTENDFLLFNSTLMLFMMAGGYATAKLAPFDPKLHTIYLGTILTVLGAVASFVFSRMDIGPDWFGWLLILSGLPFAWLGGKLKRN